MSELLDEILTRVRGMTPEQRRELEATVQQATNSLRWISNEGPQTAAYFSLADVLLYGGQGGGGKTDLILGLGFNAHLRSLILRRQYTNLSAIIERALQINGSRDGFNGSPPPRLRTADDRLIEFGAAAHVGDEQNFQGQPHDLLALDEAAAFLELQVRFLMGWVRSTVPGQRTRTVLATNPPISADGDWIIGMFRPWLDLTHPKPAEHGEIRWFVTAPDGADVEVDGPEPVEIDGKVLKPMSRTFIPAALRDNPYLAATDYQAKLDALHEPFRSAVRDGNFMIGRADDERQIISTPWIIAAQARWTPTPPAGIGMTCIGVDVSGGGADKTVLAPRYGGWYAPLVVVKDVTSSEGTAIAAAIYQTRRNGCPVVIDMGGGFGGAPSLLMRENGVQAIGFNGAAASTGQARDGSRFKFINRRAEAWWRFREALDSTQEGGSIVALPPDPELRADLASPTFEVTSRGVKVESKDDIRQRLGRSPDKGDAVVMAWAEGERALAASVTRGGLLPKVIRGYEHIKGRR